MALIYMAILLGDKNEQYSDGSVGGMLCVRLYFHRNNLERRIVMLDWITNLGTPTLVSAWIGGALLIAIMWKDDQMLGYIFIAAVVTAILVNYVENFI